MLYFTCYLLPKKARTLVPVSSPFLIGSIAFMLEFVVFEIVNNPSVHLATTKKLHSFNGFFSTISHQIRIHIYWSFEYIIIYIRYSNEESLHFAWLSTKKVGHFDWAESFRNDKFDPNVISCEHFCCFFFLYRLKLSLSQSKKFLMKSWIVDEIFARANTLSKIIFAAFSKVHSPLLLWREVKVLNTTEKKRVHSIYRNPC